MSGEIGGLRSNRLLVLFLASILFQIVSGLGDSQPTLKDASKDDAHSTSRKGTGTEVLIICLAAAVVVGLSFLLFKMWQKKKREEQHARLLRLFEEDDELELELGLRD